MTNVDRRVLKTGKSIYEHFSDMAELTPNAPSQSYYGARTSFEEDLENIDDFARALNKLHEGRDSTVAISTTAHPSNLIAYMAQNKLGRRISFTSPAVIRDDPERTLDSLDTETIIISPNFYEVAKDGIAHSEKIRNIVMLPLTEGIGDEGALMADIKHLGGSWKTQIPFASVVLGSLRRGYKSLGKDEIIPGVEYMNYDQFIAAANGDESEVLHVPRPDDPTVYLHTSGSTGKPKIIPRTDNEFTIAHNSYMDRMPPMGETDRNGSFYPLYPVTMMQSALATWMGGTEQVSSPLAVMSGRFDRAIFDERITFTTANTQAWRRFLTTELKAGSMSSLWGPVAGGESIDQRTAQAINEVFYVLGMPNRLIIGYGASEMQPGTHFEIIPFRDYDPSRAHMVGRGIGGVKTRIVGPDGREISSGEQGMIEIKPDTRAEPYYGDKAKWEDKWTDDGYYRTGDVGVLYEDGWLDVHGRDENRFIGRDGKERYLFDVDRKINEVKNSDISRLVPVSLSYPVSIDGEIDDRKTVVAYVQLKLGSEAQAEVALRDIANHAEAELELGARPLAYRFLKDFPVDRTTKTDTRLMGEQREQFYAIRDGELVEVNFGEDGSVIEKPASRIKISAKISEPSAK
jgi:acyl-coenzyme A synthetase/AMP-(fatty) acid ligase